MRKQNVAESILTTASWGMSSSPPLLRTHELSKEGETCNAHRDD